MTPVPLDVRHGVLAVLCGGRPGIVVVGVAALRKATERDERGRPFGIGRGKEDAHVAALGMPEECRPLRADRLEHGAHIIHALLQGRQLVVRDAVGETRAALVEQDQAGERREALEEVRHRRLLPHQLDVRHPARHIDEVARPLARHLVRDVEFAAPRVAGLGLHRQTAA